MNFILKAIKILFCRWVKSGIVIKVVVKKKRMSVKGDGCGKKEGEEGLRKRKYQ